MDNLCDLFERWVNELVVKDDGLESAASFVMGQGYAPDVERRGVLRNLIRVVDEGEFSIGVDETPDKPGAPDAVDMAAGARRPFHRAGSNARVSA